MPKNESFHNDGVVTKLHFFCCFFSKIWKVQFIVFFCSIQYLANQFYIFYKSNTSVNTSTIDE